mmetsp:Transcript_54349/g.143685  ORF Transcript_54349/g.143685 Transcript_54349/m.143685 type:complete len:219 (+) Transcript_54349:59-715(+)
MSASENKGGGWLDDDDLDDTLAVMTGILPPSQISNIEGSKSSVDVSTVANKEPSNSSTGWESSLDSLSFSRPAGSIIDANGKSNQIQADLDEARQQCARLQLLNEQIASSLALAQAGLTEAESKIEGLERERDQLKTFGRRAKTEVSQLRSDLDSLRLERDTLQESLRSSAATAIQVEAAMPGGGGASLEATAAAVEAALATANVGARWHGRARGLRV